MVRERVPAVDDALAALPAGELHWLRCGDLEVALATGAGGRVAHLRYRGMGGWWMRSRRVRPPSRGAATRWCRGPGASAGESSASMARRTRCRSISAGMPSMAWASRGPGRSSAWRRPRPRCRWRCRATGTGRLAALQRRRSLCSLTACSCVFRSRQASARCRWCWAGTLVSQARAAAVLAPRDVPAGREGIATLPAADPVPGPWDDCFIADSDITLLRGGQRLRLRSDHDHWVVYDGASHATCVEPQSGPPDGFTLAPHRLEPGQRLALTFELAWSVDGA